MENLTILLDYIILYFHIGFTHSADSSKLKQINK